MLLVYVDESSPPPGSPEVEPRVDAPIAEEPTDGDAPVDESSSAKTVVRNNEGGDSNPKPAKKAKTGKVCNLDANGHYITNRQGTPLCADFQSGSCPNSAGQGKCSRNPSKYGGNACNAQPAKGKGKQGGGKGGKGQGKKGGWKNQW